jgi:DNA-binding SARP family transcriptional activator/tetratricopeptide (TPR) repeat protein
MISLEAVAVTVTVQAEFGMLGPLRVRSGEAEFRVPAARQRVVLAALAVRARQAVSFQHLAEVIWDGAPPAKPEVAVRNYVSRLRQALGPVGERIVTEAPGYLLEAADDEVDLLAFIRLCHEGGSALHASAWQQASDLLGEALRLWRGVPLADIPSRSLRDEHVPVLESLRLQATEWRLEAGLHTGRHSELVPELEALAREQPLHERFRAQLMIALYRSGRQAEALAAFRSGRAALVDELGIEPGPDLQELHQRILAADPGLLLDARPAGPDQPSEPTPAPVPVKAQAQAQAQAPAPPRQMPTDLRHFVGRKDELTRLDQLLTEVGRPGGTVVISAIGGTPGIGKTALAVHWAHRVSGEFPDGQLYVNLQGFHSSGSPVPPAEAVRDFLDALGTPPERIPARPEAQAALYRTLVTGKRLLIVLDNARDGDQVRPLLPGSPGCLVLITSRATLAGLAAADGAHLIALDRPTESEARGLLARRLGPDLMTAEPWAADELIELCARLPLALSVAAARAAARPRFPLAAVAAELRETAGRLDALDAGTAASSVQAVFSWSYEQLSEPAARMFRLLGVHPGPDVCAAAAASLAGLPMPAARAALRELTAASLLTEHLPGRYAFHDLLRLYAARQAEARDTGRERRAAVRRMLEHYLHTAAAAACALDAAQDMLADGVPEAGVVPEAITDRDQALAWFSAEHKVLLECVGQASRDDFDRHARQLAWTLVAYFDRAGHWQDLAASQRVALAPAGRLGDQDGQARTHRNLGRAHVRLGQPEQARAHLSQAIELSRGTGDLAGEARAHLSMSVTLQLEHRLDESLASSLGALSLAESADSLILQATACNNAGFGYAMLGDYQKALGYCQRALDLCRQVDSPSLEASISDSLGYAYHQLGAYHQATVSYLHAFGLFRALGARGMSASTLSNLGDTQYAAGDVATAHDTWRQALAILEDLNHPDAGQVRAKLHEGPPQRASVAARPTRTGTE